MKIIILIIVLGLMVFGFIMFGINFLEWRKPYGCDIGQEDITGDFKLTSSSWYNKFYNERSCAIEDCSAYNKIQKEIGSDKRCVV